MQLGEQAAEFRKRGYGVASLTYDQPGLLRFFRQRFELRYAMLSDPESRVIRAFDILNDEIPKQHEWYGVPYPGMYLIGPDGVVQQKFFEDDVLERYTPASVLHFIEAEDGMISGWAETEHLKITVSASDYAVRPGNRITLKLNVDLRDGLHVYAPEVKGAYKPVEWRLRPSPGWKPHGAEFPESEMLHLPVIDETVPVYEDTFIVVRDITLGQLKELARVVDPQGNITVQGSFRYQACDDRECYRPQQVQLEWTLRGKLHDGERVPEELRR